MISEDEIRYYRQLDERQQRIFLGMKAKSLGVSGVRMVSETFGVNAKTVRKGKQELSALPDSPPRRVREAGGGAKKKLGAHPEWLEAFDRVVEGSTAGLPQDCAVRWTHLGRRRIVGLLAAEGQSVSSYHVAQMLALRGLKKRKLLKMNDLKKCEQREEQFEKIGCYRQCFTGLNLPVLSIDTKKKEMLGNFHRAGECYSSASRRVNDHDFPQFLRRQNRTPRHPRRQCQPGLRRGRTRRHRGRGLPAGGRPLAADRPPPRHEGAAGQAGRVGQSLAGQERARGCLGPLLAAGQPRVGRHAGQVQPLRRSDCATSPTARPMWPLPWAARCSAISSRGPSRKSSGTPPGSSWECTNTRCAPTRPGATTSP